MCGICGLVQRDARPVASATLHAMTDQLHHRGPDDAGYHTDAGVGLAMRRLKIIDIGGSDQPLYNEDRSVAVVFNGEIYNYKALRHDLTQHGHQFHTAGDGETIAHLYEQYGTDLVCHLRGMFAFALWDAKQRRLLLARDRFGQKPLYYYHDAQTLVFASEIKALLQHPAVPRESAFDDARTLGLYLGYGYVPAPLTAFKGIRALLPAQQLVWQDGVVHHDQYWRVPIITDATTSGDDAHYAALVRELLRDAVTERMMSDVPLGAFLSGGLDSSLIVALMQAHSNQTIKTFSIGFSGDDSFDETHHAQTVARHLETDHTAFTVDPTAMDLLPRLVWHHDQPFADSSAIPTYLVSDLTRQQVTVALTGDGGDELFAGYDRFYAATLVQKLGIVPRPAWQFAAAILSALPEGTGYYDRVQRAGRFARGAAQPLARAYFDWVRIASARQLHDLTASASDVAGDHFVAHVPTSDLAGILHANQTTYLPDDLLIKADRCSMAASLEVRAPFLDHHLAEMVAPMPLNLKLRGRQTKYILKQAARGLLPSAVIDRRKHGFGVPLGAWLRRDSAPVRELLLSQRARARDLLNMPAVATLIDAHAAHQRDHNRLLWALLTLEQWHRTFIDSAP